MDKKIFILLFLMLFAASIVSAYPYQLNLTDGTFMDLNASNNATNFTIYVVHQNFTQNFSITNTYQNISNNITNINLTCVNCTNNYYNNFSNSSFYNKTEADARFVLYGDFNLHKSGNDLSGYATKSEVTAVDSRITNLNVTAVNHTAKEHTGLWVVLVIAGILSLVNVIILVFLTKS